MSVLVRKARSQDIYLEYSRDYKNDSKINYALSFWLEILFRNLTNWRKYKIQHFYQLEMKVSHVTKPSWNFLSKFSVFSNWIMIMRIFPPTYCLCSSSQCECQKWPEKKNPILTGKYNGEAWWICHFIFFLIQTRTRDHWIIITRHSFISHASCILHTEDFWKSPC